MLLHENMLGKNFKVALISDEHEGNLASCEDAKMECIERIGSENMYWAHLGDAIEGIHVLDYRYSPDVHGGKHAMITAQCKAVAERYKPIKKRCIAFNVGNHEMTKSIKPIMNPGQCIVEHMGIDVPVAFTTKMRVADNVNMYLTHGRLVVNSMAGDPDQIRLNEGIRIKRKMRNLPLADCHLAATGHIHKLRLCKPVTKLHISGTKRLQDSYPSLFIGNNGEIHEDSRYYLSTGSFLKGYIAQEFAKGVNDISTYVEEAMYAPSEIGYQIVHVKGGWIDHVETVYL